MILGPGLVFVAYPQALAKMPGAQLWAVIFFAMLLCLGIDSQFATVEVTVTTIKDAYGHWVRKYLKRHEVLVLLVCFVSFLLGIPNITKVNSSECDNSLTIILSMMTYLLNVKNLYLGWDILLSADGLLHSCNFSDVYRLL